MNNKNDKIKKLEKENQILERTIDDIAWGCTSVSPGAAAFSNQIMNRIDKCQRKINDLRKD
ncbi:hypothetical protein LCGC14_3043860 [marine sediment metagenome]|uniref:Uncharacterized protein n=1 Tax=marine sediment metagenome TaxID=412755 RepID=A0A0F8YWR2_9ZZZZ